MRRTIHVAGYVTAGVLSLGWVSVLHLLLAAAGFRRLQREHPDLSNAETILAGIDRAFDEDGYQ